MKKNQLLTLALVAALFGLGTSQTAFSQTYQGSTSVNWDISFIELKDGLGGGTRNQIGVGFKFDHAMEILTVDLPSNTMRLVTSLYATPSITQFHGSNYELTVTFAPSGGVVVFDSGLMPATDPSAFYKFRPTIAQLQASYEWITGGQTYSGFFDMNIPLEDPIATFDKLRVSYENYPASVELDHNFTGFIFKIPDSLAAVHAANGMELGLSLGHYGGVHDHIGNFDSYLPDPITLTYVPEPNCSVLLGMGILSLISVRKKSVT